MSLLSFLFQLTASRRGWRSRTEIWLFRLYFNSQPHEEADTTGKVPAWLYFVFQLTASRRGWRCEIGMSKDRLYFNSQPHEEADDTDKPFVFYVFISTHSLTKRLTAQWHYLPRVISISTHSLTKRLTTIPDGNLLIEGISTHSLTKRLTIPSKFSRKMLVYFNSQPHEEADSSL